LIGLSDGILEFSNPDINDQGEIVFFAESSGFSAIYTSNNGEIDVFASTQNFNTFKAGTFDPTPSAPTINNNGDISFYAVAEVDGERFEGIFSGPDPATDVLVHGTRDARGLSGDFTYYHDTNDFGEITFATNNSLRSIDILRGTPPNFEIVASGKCDPNNGDCFDAVTPFYGVGAVPRMNNKGDVVFSGGLDDGTKSIGFVLRAGESIPEPVGVGFGSGNIPHIRDDGQVIFSNQRVGDDVGVEGIFAGPDPEIDSVILVGDMLFNREVDFAYPIAVSGSGVILFGYAVDDKIGLAIATPGSVPLGDFDSDTTLTSHDLDILTSAIRDQSVRPLFDISNDGLVNQDDRTYWIQDLAGTVAGDADLDQDVDFADFVLLSNNFASGHEWSTGDFDGNGRTEFSDFLLLSSNFGTVRRASTVPEPSSAALAMFIGIVFIIYGRNRNGN